MNDKMLSKYGLIHRQACRVWMALFYFLLATSLAGCGSDSRSIQLWEVVQNTLDASDISDMTLVVGTVDGDVYVHQKGNSTIDTAYEIASGSKWMAAATIMRLVEDGVMSLDDHPQDYIDWWDKDAGGVPINGPRSRITLAQLLSFTSGFGGNALLVECVDNPATTLEACARDIHDNFYLSGVEPGDVFYYGPGHLQVAGLMAEKATGKKWTDVFAQNLVTPLGLSNTSYVKASDDNPRVAGGVATTAREYAQFLGALLAGDLLQQSFPYMRTDRTSKAFIMDAFVIADLGYDWHYGFGEWRECAQSTWSEACEQNVSLSSPGAYGWYPWIDLEHGYYAVLALQLPPAADGDPVRRSITLAQSIRSSIEAALPAAVVAGQVSKESPAGASYANPEILSNENKMTFQDKFGDVWVADLDPSSGGFVSATGQDTFIDSGAISLMVTYNGAEFGKDSAGWSVFYSKLQDSVIQVWRASLQDGNVTTAPLTSGNSHMAAIPNRNVASATNRLFSIRGNWTTGTLAWLDETNPAQEFDIAAVDSVDTTHPNWIYDTGNIVYSLRTGPELGQLAMLDTNTQAVKTLTNDGGDKIFPYGWKAPEYNGETLVLALVDNTAIGVYRDTGAAYWTRIATLQIPVVSPGIYVNSAQAFVAAGKSYISLNIKKNDQQVPGLGDTEIWIFDLNDTPGTRFALRCDDGDPAPTMRIDPKVYLGLDQVYVYYNVFNTDFDFEVRKCATGIRTN